MVQTVFGTISRNLLVVYWSEWGYWQGELQYFIGVQLDGSEYVEPVRRRLSDNTEKESAKLVGLDFILMCYWSKAAHSLTNLISVPGYPQKNTPSLIVFDQNISCLNMINFLNYIDVLLYPWADTSMGIWNLENVLLPLWHIPLTFMSFDYIVGRVSNHSPSCPIIILKVADYSPTWIRAYEDFQPVNWMHLWKRDMASVGGGVGFANWQSHAHTRESWIAPVKQELNKRRVTDMQRWDFWHSGSVKQLGTLMELSESFLMQIW